MSEITQLSRINVPAITDASYVQGVSDAFEKINDNFKKIASLPFLQGVQGDSYQLEEYHIWEKDLSTNNWILTEDGKVLLESIFNRTITNFSFYDIKNEIKEFLPVENGVSPIDFFVDNDNNIINNSLYFYVIKDDTGNIIEKQLGQYYYFIDGRLKEIGNIYNTENVGSTLSEFNDYTGFYQYRYNSESKEQSYVKVEILPTIYYDQNKNDICWKFNGNKTGISAIGIKGADGKDSDLTIVKVITGDEGSYNSNVTSGKVVGVLVTDSTNGDDESAKWTDEPTFYKEGKAIIYMYGKVGESEQETINDFAFGEVIKQGETYIAFWEPNCVITKLFGNHAITQYFYSMGDPAYTNNAPYFLAIPSVPNRISEDSDSTKKAHVIKGFDSNIESLNIFHSENAFDEVGNQNINATESSDIKTLNIKNYGVNISKGGAVISSGGIQVSTEKPAAEPNTENDANVNSNVLIGHNNPGADDYSDFPDDIKKGGYPLVTMSYDKGSESKNCLVFGNGDIYALNWNKTENKYEPGTLCLQDRLYYSGKTKVGGALEVAGPATFGNSATITGKITGNSGLGITGAATITGKITGNSGLGITGAATITGKITGNSGLGITGAATITGKITGNRGLEITTSGATINDGLIVNGIGLPAGGTGLVVRGGESQKINTPSGAGAIIEGGKGSGIISAGTGLVVRGGTSTDTNKTGLGLKVERGGAEIYSGTGATTDANYLKVNSTSVSIGGTVGKLDVSGEIIGNSGLGITGAATITGKITGTSGATITGGEFYVNTDDANFSIKSSSKYGIDCNDQGTMTIGTNDLTIDGTVSMNSSLDVASATVRGTLGVTGVATFSKPLSILDDTAYNPVLKVGALIVEGGVGIKKNLNVGNGVTIKRGATGLAGAVIEGGPGSVGNYGGTGLVVRGGENGGKGLGLGLKVERGGAVISSGGIQVSTEKPATMTGDAKVNINSNVLTGHNNPGNGGCSDFPDDIKKGGYPLVTMSYNADGSESKNCLVFGNGDIYALNWNETANKYEPGTLCLQDRTSYFGKTLIGGSFEVAGPATFGNSATITGKITGEGGIRIQNGGSIYGGTSVSISGGNGLYVEGGYGGSDPGNTSTITVDGGVGLDVLGGSGKNGGTGICVKGGDGYQTGFAYGGAGLYVEGGNGHKGGDGIIVRGGTGGVIGNAIVTHGKISIGDGMGKNLTSISSDANGLYINKDTTIDGNLNINKNINTLGIGNTKYQTTEVTTTQSTNSITLDSGSRVYIYDKVHTGDSNLTITLNKANNNIDFPIYLLFKGGIKTNHSKSGNKTISIKVGSKTFNTGNIYNNEGYTSGLLFVIFDKFCFVQCNYSPVNAGDFTGGGQRVLY